MPNYFNRKDAQVIKDVSSLSFEAFLEKYKDQAKEVVLKAVWNDHHKSNRKKEAIKENTDESNLLVPVSEYIASDGDKVVTSKIKGTDRTVVQVETNAKNQQEAEKANPHINKKGGKSESVDKSGRTPRMRELIADKAYGKDKTKVRTQLEKEGFNVGGSGFHSEWYRLTKDK